MSGNDHPPLVNMEKLGERHSRNRVGNCRSDRETWPCRAWRDAETINGLIDTLEAARKYASDVTVHVFTPSKAADLQTEANVLIDQIDEALYGSGS